MFPMLSRTCDYWSTKPANYFDYLYILYHQNISHLKCRVFTFLYICMIFIKSYYNVLIWFITFIQIITKNTTQNNRMANTSDSNHHNKYTSRDFKRDLILGCSNGIMFSSIFGFYSASLEQKNVSWIRHFGIFITLYETNCIDSR
jgi:hypothetical protein